MLLHRRQATVFPLMFDLSQEVLDALIIIVYPDEAFVFQARLLFGGFHRGFSYQIWAGLEFLIDAVELVRD